MKIIECQQNTPEWIAARLGKPTASEFDKIITGTGIASKQMDAYANRLLAEIITGQPVQTFEKTPWMQRGNDLEAEAVLQYESYYEIEAIPVGFVLSDDETAGCSPDRLIGEEGLAEFKVPAPHTHIAYMLNQDELYADYKQQVQGQLLITGRKWCDLTSYNPGLPSVRLRIEPDVKYLATMRDLLKTFDKTLSTKRSRMVSLGYMEAA